MLLFHWTLIACGPKGLFDVFELMDILAKSQVIRQMFSKHRYPTSHREPKLHRSGLPYISIGANQPKGSSSGRLRQGVCPARAEPIGECH